MTTENNNIKVTKPRVKAITQEDLAAFKDEINELLDERLSTFVDDFFEAWDEANGSNEPSETDDKCTCDECGDPLDNPRRYLIQAGGNPPLWVDNYKPNPIFGLDVLWTEELGGKTKHVKGTVMDSNISIFDFESDMTPEIFDNIRKQTVDYAIHAAQEAQAKDKAMKAAQSSTPPDVNHVSYG